MQRLVGEGDGHVPAGRSGGSRMRRARAVALAGAVLRSRRGGRRRRRAVSVPAAEVERGGDGHRHWPVRITKWSWSLPAWLGLRGVEAAAWSSATSTGAPARSRSRQGQPYRAAAAAGAGGARRVADGRLVVVRAEGGVRDRAAAFTGGRLEQVRRGHGPCLRPGRAGAPWSDWLRHALATEDAAGCASWPEVGQVLCTAVARPRRSMRRSTRTRARSRGRGREARHERVAGQGKEYLAMRRALASSSRPRRPDGKPSWSGSARTAATAATVGPGGRVATPVRAGSGNEVYQAAARRGCAFFARHLQALDRVTRSRYDATVYVTCGSS